MSTQFAVDLVFKSQGLGKLNGVEKKLNGIGNSSGRAAAGLGGVGKAAKGAVPGIASLGGAVKAALGPIGLALAGIGGLTAAFQTLSQQNFAEAKVKTLGVNAEELRKRLEGVSRELQGQASVTQLTAASYDVASAGFNSAAEAATILKAASLGATGGFSDLNTVANATTSVLNAYGMSAANAGTLVDQFIQTQNDGKIVVAEYAREIGKVASAAASVGVPLSEVNAVIAQSTAAGVKGEVAFTGLKTALARFASGEAEKALKGTGVAISAASLEADGLLGTFKKLQAAGLDTGQIFKALGTEAAPALLPVLNNLEKYEELLENQKNAAGVAAQAQATAAGTIQGAWTRVANAVTNIFADQNELGQVIRVTLLAAAATVEALGVAFKLILAPIRAVYSAIGEVAKAFGFTMSAEQALAGLTDMWFGLLDGATLAADVIIDSGTRWGNFIGQLTTDVGTWFAELWGGISQGVGGVYTSIVNTFKRAFDTVAGMIDGFWNAIPGWLRNALGSVGGVYSSVAEAVTGTVGGALEGVGTKVNEVLDAAKNEIEFAVKNAKGASGSAFGGIPQEKKDSPAASVAASPAGGGSAGAASQVAKSRVPELEQELALKRKMADLDVRMREAQLAGDEIAIQALERKRVEAELDGRIAELQLQKLTPQERGLEVELARLEAKGKLAELDDTLATKEQDRLSNLDKMMTGFGREIELAGLKTEEAKKLKQIEYDILDLRNQGILKTDDEIAAYRRRATAAAEATQAQADGMSELKGLAEGISDTLENGLVNGLSTAVEGLVTGAEDLDESLKKILQGVLKDIANQLIKTGISSLFNSIGGGGAGGIFGGLFKAEGGPVKGGQSYIVGEEGPEIFTPGATGNILSNSDSAAAMSRYSSNGRSEQAMSKYSAGNSVAAMNAAPMKSEVIYKGPTLNFDSTQYIPRSEASSLVAQGAKQGQARALATLKNSRAQRSKLGI